MDEGSLSPADCARLARIHADLAGWTAQICVDAWQRALAVAEAAGEDVFSVVGPSPIPPTTQELQGAVGGPHLNKFYGGQMGRGILEMTPISVYIGAPFGEP